MLSIFFLVILFLFLILIPFGCNKVKRIELEENKENAKFNKEKYVKRIHWLFGYLFLSIAILLILVIIEILKEKGSVKLNIEHSRLLFCYASTFVGLYIFGFKWRIRSTANPIPAYLFYYPILLLAFSSFIFAVITIFLNKIKISSDVIFYSLAFPINVFFAYYVDNVKDLIKLIRLKL